MRPNPALKEGQALPAPPHLKQPSRHRADDLRELVGDLADLVLGDDQGRREGDGVAGDAHHQALVETAIHGLEGARADRVGAGGEVDGANKATVRMSSTLGSSFRPCMASAQMGSSVLARSKSFSSR